MSPWLSVFLPCALVTALATYLMLKSGFARLALDRPNARSLHTNPTPRSGGLPLVLMAAAVLYLAGDTSLATLVLMLAGLSFLDDRQGLPIRIRLAGQAAAAGWLILATDGFGTTSYFWPLILVVMVWSINLYNFMDGSDGLAGGMAVIGFGFLGLAAHGSLATAGFAVSGAALGFLAFNFAPARIFLGDVGSVPLGFLAAALGLYGWQEGFWPWWYPLLVFSPFAVDATFTLLRRMLRRERFWEAHREHCYQRLIRSGWSHRRTALFYYALMLACGVSGLFFLDAADSGIHTLLGGWALAYTALMFAVQRVAKRSTP